MLSLYIVSFAGMTLNKCAVLRMDVNWMHPVHGESKNPTVVYMISSCKTGVYNVRLLIRSREGVAVCIKRKEK